MGRKLSLRPVGIPRLQDQKRTKLSPHSAGVRGLAAWLSQRRDSAPGTRAFTKARGQGRKPSSSYRSLIHREGLRKSHEGLEELWDSPAAAAWIW